MTRMTVPRGGILNRDYQVSDKPLRLVERERDCQAADARQYDDLWSRSVDGSSEALLRVSRFKMAENSPCA